MLSNTSTNRKLRIVASFAALATLALAVSCRGFFVNPTLTGLSVGPSGLSLNVNQQFQMTATGTYSDGSQKTLTSGVAWSSDTPNTVKVGQTSGIVTGLQPGSANISAASGGCASCSASTKVSVVLNNVTIITVSPSSQNVTIGGSGAFFSATASPGGVDITSTATWNIQDPGGVNQNASFTIQFDTASGKEEFLPLSTAALETYTIVVSYPNTNVVGKATLIVQ